MRNITISPQDYEEIKDSAWEFAETSNAIYCMIRDDCGDDFRSLWALSQRAYSLARRLEQYIKAGECNE